MDNASNIGFTKTVKAIQERKGSRRSYENAQWQTEISDDLASYIANMRSVFVSTANGQGYPYIQHKGGPPGFLHVLDRKTIAHDDFKRNRQFITQGNLQDNPRTFMFMIDFLNSQRVKLWGCSEIIEDDPDLLARLMPDPSTYNARPEQVFKFTVEAWDVNCPQHIPQRVDAKDFNRILQEKDLRIAELEAALEQSGA
ncbi:pyridoxamine 5'-phosphate oxidase family protein [Roseobacter sp.]|uniref:pyridoxamine 5'-phosphate oxidase family protein n=1 Tax=Roseobacter sp. TaxID=1907202 RepID=UPI0029660AC7|nr:pyridoxamine 5'-phosphate oxidase family protein [Roseobacter sp.]